MPEMPFPLGSAVQETVKIVDSSGNTISTTSGKLHILNDLAQTESLGNIFDTGDLKQLDGSCNSDTIIYTVPSGKRFLLLYFSGINSGAEGEWDFSIGYAFAGRPILRVNSDTSSRQMSALIVIGAGKELTLEEASGAVSCGYQVVGIEWTP